MPSRPVAAGRSRVYARHGRAVLSRIIAITLLALATAGSAAAQIIDRPPAQPKPRAQWGVLVGVAPSWTTPAGWARLFFQDLDTSRTTRFEGRDLRLGVVRSRQLGFEWGLSYVRKSLNKDFELPMGGGSYGFNGQTFTPVNIYTGLENVEVTGFDSHVVIPAARIGRRVMIGALLAGGIGALPETAVTKTIEGPPFFECSGFNQGIPLANPPATNGCVQDNFNGVYLPLAPSARSASTTAPFTEISLTDQIWLFMRTQLAVDVMIARPLKVRFAGGLNFPSAQYFGVDLIYLVTR